MPTNMLRRFLGGAIMLLRTKRGRQTFRQVVIAALCVPAFNDLAVAQTLQPKVTPAPAASAQPALPTPQWIVTCGNTKAGLDCNAAQSIVVGQGGREVRVSVAVRVPADTKTPVLLLALPLGVYLPPGVTLQFGDGGAKAIPFQSCNPGGCVAEYAITQAEIASLLNGADLALSVQTPDKASFKSRISTAGFAAAYAKIKPQ
jgi:invasion protein IalB